MLLRSIPVRTWVTLAALLAAAVVDVSVFGAGLPALRHDWRIPAGQDAFEFQLLSYMSGWIDSGIGAPQPYPTFYLVAAPLWVLARAGVAPAIVIGLLAAASTMLSFLGAAKIARINRMQPAVQLACGAFASLNPWCYSEYVAGHVFMVFGLATCIALIAEMRSEHPREPVLILLAALTVTQIEFYAILIVPLVWWSLSTRRPPVAVAGLAAALPIVLGLALEHAALAGIPYLLPWQRMQSVPLHAALMSLGAPPGYDRGFNIVWPALAAGTMLAVPGLVRAFGTRFDRVVVISCVAGVAFATGSSGVLAPLYDWLVVHVRATAVFRELFDLVGLASIATMFGWALGPKQRAFSVGISLVAIASAAPWLVTPVDSWTVPAAHIPTIALPEKPLERVALLPAFQPLSFDGRGSGVDPDAYPLAGHALPVNTPELTYPVDAALGNLERGSGDLVASIGVEEVLERPYLSQSSSPPAMSTLPSEPPMWRSIAGAVPIFSYATRPPTVANVPTIADPLDEYVGDAMPMLASAPRVDQQGLSPSAEWIDARLVAGAQPELASPFGGVYTTSQNTLPIVCRSCRDVLALVHGQLVTNAGPVARRRSDTAYHWYPLPAGATTLRCTGACAIALFGTLPATSPDAAASVMLRPLSGSIASSWAIRIDAPPAPAWIRYNVRFDSGWMAACGTRILAHLRIDATVNGWVVPSPCNASLWIVHVPSALQAFAMLLASITILALIFTSARRNVRQPLSFR